MSFLAAKWRSLEAWFGSGSSFVALFVLALAVFALESVFLPAYPGRDMSRYLQTFFQLGYHVPVYPAVLDSRGPLTALGVGVPLELGGWAAQAWLALLYAFSIVAWARVALTFGSRAAIVTSALLLVYPGYGILFHQLASDSLFAAAFAGWALLVTRAIQRPSIRMFAFAGIGIGVLVLVRPANQVLLVMALLPLALRTPWRNRFAWVAASFIPAVLLSQTWKVFAEHRYGNAVALKPSAGLLALAFVAVPLLLPSPWRLRAGAAVAVLAVAGLAIKGLPGESPGHYARSVIRNESNQFLYRSFELDRIIRPENGPAARRLAGIVRRELLPREPYRSYGIDVHEFFASGSDRVFGDLRGVASASDLAAATREAIRRHPRTFVSNIGRTLWDQLAFRPVYAPENVAPPGNQPQIPQSPDTTEYIVVKGKQLPKPTEGQPIPASAIGPLLWTTGGPAQEVWKSPTQHSFVFTSAQDKRRYDKLGRDVDRLSNRIPTYSGNQSVLHRLNQASHRFPPLVAWLVIGLIGFTLRRPRNALVALAPCVAGLIVISATALLVPAVPEYAAPVSPAFLLLAASGVFGVPVRSGRRAVPASWRAVAGVAVGVVAAVWAVTAYAHLFSVSQAPHDLGVFLRAAGDVIHGDSPFAWRADATYAYPPLLAFLVAPLHPLSVSAATIVWTLVSFAAIAASLWLLGLRDWRCYALAAVFPFTRSAIDLGTVAPLLLLAVAVAWRWRDRVVEPALALGAGIALKLFLWPLVAWLALMRRLKAGLVAVGMAILLALLPWAAIGFAGLGGYSHLLRRLADEEASSSYSVVALAVRAHLPQGVGVAISLIVTVAILASAAWVARGERFTPENRDIAVLTLTLTAAFAASPIVWVHYFLLLLVPLVLAQPRLSWLWFVPFAYYPLGESAWPAGDARKLGLALAATLIVLGTVLYRTLKPVRRPAHEIAERPPARARPPVEA